MICKVYFKQKSTKDTKDGGSTAADPGCNVSEWGREWKANRCQESGHDGRTGSRLPWKHKGHSSLKFAPIVSYILIAEASVQILFNSKTI